MADANINDILVDDLLIEILSRFPCKTAIGSKIICHRWNSIISSPQFASAFISRAEHRSKIGPNRTEDQIFFFKPSTGPKTPRSGPNEPVQTKIWSPLFISHQTGCNREDNKVIITHFRKKQLFITPTHLGPADLDLSLDYIPGFHGRFAHILSSCNGLLLWYNGGNLLNDGTLFICNPVTKQWASIPRLRYRSLDVVDRLGFVCDPHYHIDDRGGVLLNPHCRFRVVRLFAASEDCSPQIDVDVFSSETGEWTKRWISRKKSYTDGCNYSIKRVMTYDNKIQIQVGASIVIYDPFNDKVCGDIDPPTEAFGKYTSLEGFSWSQQSLWVCQLRNQSSTLYVWRLIGKEDDNDQRWSLERQVVLRENTAMGYRSRVLTIHPDNPNIVFLTDDDNWIWWWDLEKRTRKLVGEFRSDFYLTWANTFILELPVWPYFTTYLPSTSRVSN